MKVAFVVGSLHMGGLEKVTIHIVNALSNKYNIDLIILHQNNNFYDINESVNILEGNIKYSFYDRVVRKIERILEQRFEKCHWKEINYLSSVIEKEKYDKIIAVDGNNAMILNCVKNRLNLKKKINYITWIHNNYDTYFNNYFRNFKKDLMQALGNSQYVVTLTNQDKDMYAKHNNNTICIYNPVTLDNVQITELKNKEILFVARLVKEQKGLDYLIEIGKRLKGCGWNIRVLGDGNDREWLENEIDVNDLTDIFILEGSVKDNIESYYGKASIFISTSRWEGFGLVITEAMSCGLPVVAFENSGPNEILNHGEYGVLIPQYNVDEFAKALIRLIENLDELKYYNQKSLVRANDFSLSKIINQWEQIIEQH